MKKAMGGAPQVGLNPVQLQEAGAFVVYINLV